MINALENSGFAYTLARPSLTVLSGQTASFLAGGEIPIPVPSAGSDNVSIEYKEFGVRLALTPTVISQGRITLKVAPEVSELDYSNVVTIAGTQVPGLTVRRTDTSIALADGESFIISGLVSNNTRSAVDRLPGWVACRYWRVLPQLGHAPRRNRTADDRHPAPGPAAGRQRPAAATAGREPAHLRP